MIQFYGELSDECLDFIHQQKNKIPRGKIAVVAVLVFVTIFVYCIFDLQNFLYSILIAVASAALWCVGSIFTIKRTRRNPSHNFKSAYRITIDANNLSLEAEMSTTTFPTSAVKRVVDCGDWYQICFAKSKTPKWYCQKNLLVCGTLDQFEEIFKERLVRQDG